MERRKHGEKMLDEESRKKLDKQSAIADFLGIYVGIGFPLAVLVIWTIVTLAGC